MRKIVLALLFLGIINLSFGQTKKINHLLFKFKIDEQYKLIKKDSASVSFIDTLQIDTLVLVKGITVSKANIDPVKNGIKTIADFSKFSGLSFVSDEPENKIKLEGLTNIGGRDIYYYCDQIETFTDSRKNKITNYTFKVQYYFLESGKVFRLQQFFKLDNNNESEYDKDELLKLMKRNTNIGALNKIISSLKLKV